MKISCILYVFSDMLNLEMFHSSDDDELYVRGRGRRGTSASIYDSDEDFRGDKRKKKEKKGE